MAKGASRIINAFAAVRDALAGDVRKRDNASPVPGKDAWGYGPFEWPGYPDDKLPPDCPVTPLGLLGDTGHFVDPLGQVRPIKLGQRSDDQLFGLFAGHSNFVKHHWPGRNKEGQPVFNNIEKREAWNCLWNSAARMPLFDPAESLRGRGGWCVGSMREHFVWHAGDDIFTTSNGTLVRHDIGWIENRFYAAGPPMVRPYGASVADEDSPALDVFRHLASWRYRRPVFDPLMVLGWMACAFYGGALEQRPIILMTGDRGQGKSTMKQFVKDLLQGSIVVTDNATAMGIAQRIRMDSLAVWVDEFEASAYGNQRATQIVELARQAYTGSTGLRGGADHKGHEFTSRGSFFFSAINPPPMEASDYSRMAVLNMLRLEVGTDVPDFPRDPAEASRMILRRLIDEWPRFNGYLKQWRKLLRQSGLDARFCDTFGTLLAGAHVLLADEGMEEAGVPITAGEDQLAAWIIENTAHERSLIVDNWRACLEHLLAQQIAGWDTGKKPTVGQVLRAYEANRDNVADGDILSIGETRKRLEAAGLGIIDISDGRAAKVRTTLRARADWQRRHEDDAAPYLLAVPYKGPVLAEMFRNTKWQQGGWRTALQQAPGSVVLTGADIPQKVKIGRATEWAIIIDMAGYDEETGVSDA